MPKKALIIIAAVAVMLVAATSAYGDDYTHESWNGWFRSGTLTYNMTAYTVVENTCNEVEDSTYIFPPRPGRDMFGRWTAITYITFICADDGDSIFVYIATVTGGKEYGTSGTHEGSGSWSGEGYSDSSAKPETKLFDFGGTWEATFDYGPKTYEGTWMKTWSDTPGVSGSGTCSGHRTYYR